MNETKIVIADDHQLFRNGIKALLASKAHLQVVGEAGDVNTLNQWLGKNEADILLLDISLPDGNGLKMLEELKENYAGLKIIMLTMHDEAQYVVQSIRKGADGYLLKDSDENELLAAIKAVSNGKKYFKDKVSELILEDIVTDAKPKKQIISDREKEIVQLVAKGLTTKEIADQLFVSIRTVETHRGKIMKKLKVSNSAEMISTALRHKLIDPV